MTDRTPWHRRWRIELVRRLRVLVVVLLAANMAAVFAGWHWIADLFSNFAPHYAAAAALLLIALAALRRWHWALLCLVLLGANLWRIADVLPAFPHQVVRNGYGALIDDATAERAVRVLAWNVNARHPDPDRALAWILEHESAVDVVVLLEISPRWEDVVTVLTRFYPHSHVQIRDDHFGLAVFSRLTGSQLRPLAHARSGLASTLLSARTTDGTALAIWAMHPPPPLGGESANERNRQLVSVAHTARVSPLPMLVVGDLNVTPWSPWFRRMLATGLLVDLAAGAPRGTWAPGWWPVDLGLPLDHVLGTTGMSTTGRLLGPRLGSDHRPVITRIIVPQS